MSAKETLILGIETSCDDTAAAVVKNGRAALSNVISSQTKAHERFGGVVPEIASRKHIEAIADIVDMALEEAGVPLGRLDGVAVTYGPGLVGALLVGLSYGKALAYATDKPLLGVHHIEGHMFANLLKHDGAEEPFLPPFVCLVASGGHTNVIYVRAFGEYDMLGATRDDAAGEAFDKVARALGLGYPGGPRIDALSEQGRGDAIAFPRAKLETGSLDFSFSGLKSAVLNHLNKANMTGETINKADVAASFQKSVIDVLVERTAAACDITGCARVAMAGGVSSNRALRAAMTNMCGARGISLHIPPPVYCTDNAAMIAVCGHELLTRGKLSGLDLNAVPGLQLAGEAFTNEPV